MHSGAEKLNLAYSADFNVTQTFRFDKSLSSDDLKCLKSEGLRHFKLNILRNITAAKDKKFTMFWQVQNTLIHAQNIFCTIFWFGIDKRIDEIRKHESKIIIYAPGYKSHLISKSAEKKLLQLRFD